MGKTKLRAAYRKAGKDSPLLVRVIVQGKEPETKVLREQAALRLLEEAGKTRRITVSGLIGGKLVKIVLGRELGTT